MRNARRMRLRYDERRGVLKLTCPARTSRRAALNWAAGQREWVDAQIAAAADGEPFLPGTIIPLAGEDVTLVWCRDAARTPHLLAGKLVCGGPEPAFPQRVERFLKKFALDTLSADTVEFATSAGVTVRAVSVGDPSSRWGSCTSQARIRYSWRLILAPPEARRFVVAHEVAHLVHLNHGPEFRALEAKLFGTGVAAAKASLRRVGHRLKGFGRGI
ncbi:MAG: M48 family metallopeptidase [Sphingomicrobium sp.]